MKFCPHCGKGNQYQMPYCAYCGHQLVMGDSLNYKQAKKNFDAYMDAHPDEEVKFDHKHFQLCLNCHRKCPLTMDFCAWCGAKLNHQDQHDNYKLLVTTSNIIPGFSYQTLNIVLSTVKLTQGPLSESVSKVIQNLKDQCQKNKGNAVIGFHILINNSSLIAYGTSIIRKPLK